MGPKLFISAMAVAVLAIAAGLAAIHLGVTVEFDAGQSTTFDVFVPAGPLTPVVVAMSSGRLPLTVMAMGAAITLVGLVAVLGRRKRR